jgi:2-polyprenyl-6-methoxyphenol hydroxylase-like FAD-dependent oxidoreductase
MTLASIPRYDIDRLANDEGHAVVVGASMAGMAAARVLADAYETVTLIERDLLPTGPVSRRGIPQGNHVHLLLEAGRATLEDLFPGFSREVLAAGGVLVDAATDLTHYEHGGTLAEGPERLPLYCASRPLYEHVVRQRLADRPEVTIRSNCRFIEYCTDDAQTAVTGVVINDGTGETELATDLVVDATGRTSRTPAWLEDHGYTPPPVEEIDIDVTYGTVALERPPDNRRTFLVTPSPANPRGAAAVPIEGDRWLVTLFGLHGESPPTDRAGFLDYAASLPDVGLTQLLTTREWATDEITQYPFPSNLRRRYEQLERFPDGLLVTGDGIASFNPIYGQGMTVAALDALQLHHALASSGRENVATNFFERAGTVVDDVWNIAVGSDFELPQTEGSKPRGTAFFNWYISRLVRAAHTDGVLRNEYYRVIRLETPPTALFQPSILRRVFHPKQLLGRSKTARPSPTK